MPKKEKNSTGKPKRRIRFGRIIFFLFVVVFMAALTGGVLVAGWVFSLAKDLPEITAQELVMNQTSFVYDKDGREIGSLHAGENRNVVELSEMPQMLIDTLLASEDIRFYDHFGVDVRSVARAVVVDTRDTIKNRSLTFTQGASTITMQLVRNVVADTEKKMERKVKEGLLAMQFEKKYDKDEILYLYMNEIYLGPRIYGFDSAAEYYFGKELKDITLAEAATMVGVLRNANYYSPYQQPERAVDIRNTVLNSLIVYYGDQYETEARAAMKEPLVLSETASANLGVDYDHPWFVDYVLTEASSILTSQELPVEMLFTGGLQVYTTLDPKIQTSMEHAFANEENFDIKSNTGDMVESGMAIVRPATGEIVGLVGGRAYETRRGFNRATSMQRQPGSSIKPIVAYGPAVELGQGPGTIIDDAPFTGTYDPHNSDRAYKGRITMRSAIVGSRNTCAVRTLQSIGTQVGWTYAVNMGLPLAEEDAYYSSIALGGLTRGVSPLDMAGAFATFANGGVYTKPYSVSKIVDARGTVIYEAEPLRRQVFSEQTAWLITDMLTSAVTGGTGTAARLANWPTAGKTGTVELPSAKEDPDYAGKSGHRDIWFAGYTPELCGAVWMGYDNKRDADGNIQYLPKVFGGGPTAKLWKAVMTECHEGLEPRQFTKPNGLASITIDLKSGKLPSELTPPECYGSEWFNAKNVPTEQSDIWTVVELCADSSQLAGMYCPNKTAAVKIRVEDEVEISTSVADYAYYAPRYYCTEHTTLQGDLQACYICTDQRHGTERVLANVSSFGGSDGCPAENVELRYYGTASMPTQHCALEGHQLTDGGYNNPFLPPTTGGDTGNNDGWLGSGGTSGGNSGGSTGGSSGSGKYATDENGAPILQTPYSLAAYPSTQGCLISWAADNDPANTSYRVQKITDGDEATEIRYSVSGYSFDDNYIEEGHVYTYRVYAYNEAHGVASGWSQSVSFSL